MQRDTKIGVGAAAGILASAGAAAGYYFYASKGAQKNRRVALKWTKDLKDDVLRQAKKVQDIDRSDILNIIDGATKMYESVRGLDRNDLARAADELKNNWERLQEELVTNGRALLGNSSVRDVKYSAKGVAKKAKRSVKKAVRSVAKKGTKRSSR